VPDHFVLRHRLGQSLPAQLAHLVHDKTASGGRATAYICRGPRCTAPLTDPGEVRDRLRRPGAGL
jgi:uncharacterized protein YyaL (SSP411 family)